MRRPFFQQLDLTDCVPRFDYPIKLENFHLQCCYLSLDTRPPHYGDYEAVAAAVVVTVARSVVVVAAAAPAAVPLKMAVAEYCSTVAGVVAVLPVVAAGAVLAIVAVGGHALALPMLEAIVADVAADAGGRGVAFLAADTVVAAVLFEEKIPVPG